jgi:hypothetical protein
MTFVLGSTHEFWLATEHISFLYHEVRYFLFVTSEAGQSIACFPFPILTLEHLVCPPCPPTRLSPFALPPSPPGFTCQPPSGPWSPQPRTSRPLLLRVPRPPKRPSRVPWPRRPSPGPSPGAVRPPPAAYAAGAGPAGVDPG